VGRGVGGQIPAQSGLVDAVQSRELRERAVFGGGESGGEAGQGLDGGAGLGARGIGRRGWELVVEVESCAADGEGADEVVAVGGEADGGVC